jgi:predicted Rossmann fold nucleotide-binding protein DprA/Smf involved in DNA uptake
MVDTPVEAGSEKEALKKLKAARKDRIAAATGRMKVQRQALKAIKARLADLELTVPEIAEGTGLPVSEVLWYVATMKKYGEILEGPKAGGYYRYRLGQPAAAETEPEQGD